jgi:putative thiamine transport system substrate-binding protein
MNRRSFGKTALSTLALMAFGPRIAFAGDWDAILAEAKGQTVYWHAWGGDPKINDFIAFIGGEAQARFGVTLEHVKLASTADAVARVLAERDAGAAGL